MDEPLEQRIAFIQGLRSSAARVEHATVANFVRRVLLEYGRAQLFEWLHAADVGKVVFDVDGKPPATADALLAAAIAAVAVFLGHTPPRIVIASSHGPAKLSFRLWLPDYRMLLGDIKKRILRLALDDKHGGPFDPAVYGSNQKLRLPGSIKSPDDQRLLQLVDSSGVAVEPTAALLRDCLVQVVDPRAPLLTEDAATAAPKRARSAAPPPVAPGAEAKRATPTLSRPARGKPPQDRPRAERLLATAGFSNINWLSTTRPESATFDCDRGPCACCSNTHDNQHWWCSEDDAGALTVRNYSPSCMARTLRDPPPPPPAAEAAEAIVTHQQAEEHIKTLQSAVYTLGVYAQQQQSHIDAAITPLRMAFDSVVPTTYGFDFSCEGREDIFRCNAIIQSCCEISSGGTGGAVERPLITGFHSATLLAHLADNPTKGDAVYAQWMLLDQRHRGVSWKYDVKVERIYRNAQSGWETVEEHTLRTLFAHMAIEGLSRVVENIDSINPPLPKKAASGLRSALHHVQCAAAPRAAPSSPSRWRWRIPDSPPRWTSTRTCSAAPTASSTSAPGCCPTPDSWCQCP